MPRSRSGSRWLRRLAVPALLAGLLLVVPGTAQAQSCSTAVSGVSGAGADFDGDGKVDLAIGDPDATVSGQARAGRVHIAYGDGVTQTITPNNIPDNDNGAGERFGFSMDTVDWNGDGCTDLFIGAPYENWSNNSLPEAGAVVFIPGSPAGLDLSQAKNWSSAIHGADSAKANVRFGWDLAAGLDKAGKPYLVVGMPGRDTVTTSGETLFDIGAAVYIRPTAAKLFNQNAAGVSDAVEDGDMFGYSVSASESGFVVGVPGESANFATPLEAAGVVHLFAHNDAATTPSMIAGWGQGSSEITGEFETGDLYGYSLDMVDYISSTGGLARMMIAVGAPGQADGADTSAGMSMVLWSPGSGITEYKYITQKLDGNASENTDPGDVFGAAVAMVNRTPGQNTGTDTLLMAVGAPGEDTGASNSIQDVGEVSLFSMTEDVSVGGDTVSAALSRAGYGRVQGAMIGATVHATKTHHWVTSADPAAPAVYGIPWDNIVATGTAAVKVYTPATFGLTNADVVSFGASLA